MTTVVSDTSPINYLCLIEAIEVLPALFSEVWIPPAVVRELQHPQTPVAVSQWMENPPPWVRQQAPAALQPRLNLDEGEAEAISLALELGVSTVLLDETTGREAALELGLAPFGTLGVLRAAAIEGLIDLEDALTRLRATSFHVRASIVDALLEEARAGKSGSA